MTSHLKPHCKISQNISNLYIYHPDPRRTINVVHSVLQVYTYRQVQKAQARTGAIRRTNMRTIHSPLLALPFSDKSPRVDCDVGKKGEP